VPVVTLSDNSPNPQPAGNTAIIAYSATNTPTSCNVNVQGGYQGSGPVPSGSSTVTFNIGAVNATSLVQVTCSNGSGTSAAASLTITVQSGTPSGCSGPTDPNCDPNMGLVTDALIAGSNTELNGPINIGSGTALRTCPAGARYKVRTYQAKWKSWHSLTGSISESVTYGVCYVPNSTILFASAFSPGNVSGSWFWSWQAVNDNGYPSAGPTQGAFATFKWQGSVAFCVFGKGCGPTKHPGVSITFYPNDTEAINEWVG
jgi:hypothetical protein